jgi:hypothetical protein
MEDGDRTYHSWTDGKTSSILYRRSIFSAKVLRCSLRKLLIEAAAPKPPMRKTFCKTCQYIYYQKGGATDGRLLAQVYCSFELSIEHFGSALEEWKEYLLEVVSEYRQCHLSSCQLRQLTAIEAQNYLDTCQGYFLENVSVCEPADSEF